MDVILHDILCPLLRGGACLASALVANLGGKRRVALIAAATLQRFRQVCQMIKHILRGCLLISLTLLAIPVAAWDQLAEQIIGPTGS